MEQKDSSSLVVKGRLSTLARGLVVLEFFASAGTELGITQISKRLSISKSTAHRIASTLADHGYLHRDESTGAYRLGLKCWEIGCAAVAQLNLVDVARPHLCRLAELSQENVRLAILQGGEIIYIYGADGSHALRPASRVGQRGPAHGTGTGMALLAYQSPEYFENLFAQGPSPFRNGRAITTEELRQELDRVRSSGVAVVRGSWHRDVAAIAAPIRNHTGNVIAAAGVSGALTRFTDETVCRLSQMVVATVEAISRELGYMGHDLPSAAPGSMGPTDGLDGSR
jgi:IclR family KDG regulon transcriptional repressor